MSQTPDTLGSNDGSTHSEVPAMFRVGGEMVLDEYFDGTAHRLAWEITEEDKRLAPLAGWDKFDLRLPTHDSIAILSIPDLTRNASSILGGVEAWSGEKRSLIAKLSEYITEVHKAFGGIDVAASISRMGVVQGETESKVFFAPPHRFSQTPQEISEWVKATEEDIAIVLRGDPNLDLLISLFRGSLDQGGLRKAS